MTWHRMLLRDFDWAVDRGDRPFLVFPDFEDETCLGTGVIPAHRLIRWPQPVSIAWTGRDIRADFELVSGQFIVASPRAVNVLTNARIRGIHFVELNHVGIAEWRGAGNDVTIDDADVGSEIRGHRQLVIEQHPGFDRAGIEVVTCPICGYESLQSSRTFDTATQLTFSDSIDVARLRGLLEMHFANAQLKKEVEDSKLHGLFFFDLRNFQEEINRTSELTFQLRGRD